MSERSTALVAAADAAPYHARLGIRVAELTTERVRLSIPYKDENSNPGRALHGGVYASAIDAAGVLAAWSGVDEVESLERRTLDLTVHYLAAAIGEDIEADARVRRRGKELAYVAVDVRTSSGKDVATGMLVHRMAPTARADRRLAAPEPAVTGTAAPASAAPHVPKLAGALMAVPFMAARGMRIVHMRDGFARVEMPWSPGNADGDGGVHEGAIAALLDTAGAMASWSVVGLDFRYKASTVAIALSVHLRPPADGLVAHARVLGRENESFLAAVAIVDSGGRTVANGSVTYRIVVPD